MFEELNIFEISNLYTKSTVIIGHNKYSLKSFSTCINKMPIMLWDLWPFNGKIKLFILMIMIVFLFQVIAVTTQSNANEKRARKSVENENIMLGANINVNHISS